MPIVTTANQIQCPHGGQAVLVTTNSSLTVSGVPALLQTDQPIIAGCTFVIGVVPSPCMQILWVEASTSLTVNKVGVVLESSQGLCCNAAGAPQGPAVINSSTPGVDAI